MSVPIEVAASALFPGPTSGPVRRVSVRDLALAKQRRERWPMLTAYDALTAAIFDEAGIPVLLVGDSAAQTVFGYPSTVPVTVDELLPLVSAVVRSTSRALVVADLPFGSYQLSPEQAFTTAARFLKEAGAHAVKFEGGARVLPHVELLAASGVPVMGHLGLTPQSALAIGYRVQGRGEDGERLVLDAKALEQRGAFALVLEAVPVELARRVAAELTIPVIGIGAGVDVDAQVLVWQDMAGLTPDPAPRFVRRYGDLRSALRQSVVDFGTDVTAGRFPADNEHYT